MSVENVLIPTKLVVSPNSVETQQSLIWLSSQIFVEGQVSIVNGVYIYRCNSLSSLGSTKPQIVEL